MFTRHLARAAAVLALVALGGTAPTSGRFGPAWISIEYPANPYDRDTREAYLVVHAFHHQVATGLPVEGRAEGLVSGARKTIPLTFRPTSRTGAFALDQQWPKDGNWILVITAKQGEHGGATALVEIGRDGRVSSVRVPTRRMPDNGYVIPADVTAADVDAALARVSRSGVN